MHLASQVHKIEQRLSEVAGKKPPNDPAEKEGYDCRRHKRLHRASPSHRGDEVVPSVELERLIPAPACRFDDLMSGAERGLERYDGELLLRRSSSWWSPLSGDRKLIIAARRIARRALPRTSALGAFLPWGYRLLSCRLLPLTFAASQR
jgi:hypothetical protein